MALIETLTDDFSTNSLATKWAPADDSTYGATITGGVCNVVCTPQFDGSLHSALTYTSAGSYWYAKVTAAPKRTSGTPADVTCNTVLGVKDSTVGDGYNTAQFLIDTVANTISCQQYGPTSTGTPYTDISTSLQTAYNATTMAWLAIDFRGSQIRWLYSSNGTTWTDFGRVSSLPTWASLATNFWRCEPYREDANGEATTSTFSTNAVIDNFNTGGTAPTAPAAGASNAVKTGFMAFMMD